MQTKLFWNGSNSKGIITSLLVVPYCKARLMNLQNCLDILTLSAQKVGFWDFATDTIFVSSQICGEAASVSSDDCNEWMRKVFPTIVEGQAADKIYNADETGLFFKLTPNKTLQFKGEKCTSGKMSREQITVLVVANMMCEKENYW